MREFYCCLPSSVVSNCAENATSHYRTTLKNPLILTGNWEVGLVEVSFPKQNQHKLYKFKDEPLELLTIMDSFVQQEEQVQTNPLYDLEEIFEYGLTYHEELFHYFGKLFSDRLVLHKPQENRFTGDSKTVKHLTHRLNRIYQKHFFMEAEKGPRFDLDEDGYVTITPGIVRSPNIYGSKCFCYPLVSDKLAIVLGIKEATDLIRDGFHNVEIFKTDREKMKVRGTQKPMFDEAVDYFVYSNLIDQSIVGDSTFRLLRRVHVPQHQLQQHNQIYTQPYYHPLASNTIVDIEIDFRDFTGEYINFPDGSQSTVVLHFRCKSLNERELIQFKDVKNDLFLYK